MNKINIYKCLTTDKTYLEKGMYEQWLDASGNTVFGRIIMVSQQDIRLRRDLVEFIFDLVVSKGLL